MLTIIWSGSLHYPPHDAPTSGVQQLIGFTPDLSNPDGSTRVTLDLGPQHLNVSGVLHGGLHTLMLDVAAGFACARHCAMSGPFVPMLTLSLTTDYIGAVREGQIVATGRVTGGGFKILYAEAQLHDAEGRLLSRATGVFKRAKT